MFCLWVVVKFKWFVLMVGGGSEVVYCFFDMVIYCVVLWIGSFLGLEVSVGVG